MKALKFSPLSKHDISDIWDYTAQNWDDKQAVKYIKNLRNSCHSWSQGIALGSNVDIRNGYMKYLSEKHFIYYQESDTKITIIRILHARMDAKRHL